MRVVVTPAYVTTTVATPAFLPLQFAVATLLAANLGLAGVQLTIPAGVDVIVAVLTLFELAGAGWRL
jgi:hypothetical protein